MQQSQYSIIIDGKEIPAHVYWKQRRLDELSANAKLLLAWLKKCGKKLVSTVELCKRLTPTFLRRAGKIRQLMQELIKCGLVAASRGKIFYSGRWRQEGWELLF